MLDLFPMIFVSWNAGECPPNVQLSHPVKAGGHPRVVARDVEELVPLEVWVVVDSIYRHRWRGNSTLKVFDARTTEG
jgi:hypothetical protein